MADSCHPSMYNTVTEKGVVTYGWRCAVHNIPSKRYESEELRNIRLKEHIDNAKKDAKQS